MLNSQFWQVLVNFHSFTLEGKWNCWLTWKMTDKEVLRLHLTQAMFSTSLVSFDFLTWKKMICKKVVLWGTTPPPLPLDLIQLLLVGPRKWIYLTFVWIKICNCWFSGQSLSSSEDDDIAWKQKPKENQKRKKKGKNIIDSGNVLGWTWTVSKGTDVETLHKLLHLCFCFNGVLCCTVSLSILNVICIITETASRLAQLVRALDCCAGGRGFEPRLDQHSRS